MNFLSLITRSLNEPFINEFIEHYLNEGFDEIHIIVDGIDNISDKLKKNPKVKRHTATFINQADELVDVNTVFRKIRWKTKWVAFLDADEFIITRKNLLKSIRCEFEGTFSNAHLVRIPWVMFSSNGTGDYERLLGLRKWDPQRLINENTLRWDHDRRHPHPFGWSKGRCRYDAIETKSIFKPEYFSGINHPHFPTPDPKNGKPICVESVDGLAVPIHHLYSGLREASISRAYLTCNHYRIPSFQSCVRKTRYNKLKDYSDVNILKNLICTDYSEIEDSTAKRRALLWKHGSEHREGQELN
jgi:hypothetical protein